jgi:ABC-2 type transport system permease protein
MAANTLATEGVTASERTSLHGSAPQTSDAASAQGSGGASAMVAMTQRELASLFYSPIAYVVGFIFLVVTGYIFVTDTLEPGNEASMRTLFEWMAYLLVFAVPILTMRSVAEEFSSGAIEMLMTAPVSDGAVILGKFFGTLLFYCALLATTIPHLILMSIYAQPIFSVVLVSYLGMILLGGLFIAVGLFASSCTRHQLLAAIIAIAILSLLTFGADRLAERGGTLAIRSFGAYVNILGHFSDFAKGILDTGSLIFFVSGTVFFLFLATKVLESRRWR